MQSKMKFNVGLLALCQALMMTAMSLMITTSALVGFALATDKKLATLPLAFQFLGMMCSTFPASLLMRRIGRRGGFYVGLSVGAVGAAIATYGIASSSFWTFTIGLFFIGVFSAFGQYYRFAAADVADASFKAKAISLVLAGGVVASFAGPNLARFAKDLLMDIEFAGAYLTVIVIFAASMVVLSFVRIPPPSAEETTGKGRPLRTIARQSRFRVAVLGATVGYGAMNILMTSTPLAMQGFGHAFADTAFVIQWHVFGMFAPAFFTGNLIKRFGVLNIMATGALLLLLCIAVGMPSTSVIGLWASLFLLGVGWNFLFVGGTTLLTETYVPNEKARTQGLNELIVFGTVSITALLSGVLYNSVGWMATNLLVVPFILLVLVAIFWLKRHPDIKAEAAPAVS